MCPCKECMYTTRGVEWATASVYSRELEFESPGSNPIVFTLIPKGFLTFKRFLNA